MKSKTVIIVWCISIIFLLLWGIFFMWWRFELNDSTTEPIEEDPDEGSYSYDQLRYDNRAGDRSGDTRGPFIGMIVLLIPLGISLTISSIFTLIYLKDEGFFGCCGDSQQLELPREPRLTLAI